MTEAKSLPGGPAAPSGKQATDAVLADRRLLAEQYMPYVHGIASKIKKNIAKEVPFEDLVEYGMIGLLEAADRFDPANGANFMTFAYYRIRGAIYDGLRGMGWMSRSAYARARFEERANQYLSEVAQEELGGPAAGPAPQKAGARATGPAAAAVPATGQEPASTASQAPPASAHPLEHIVHNLTAAVHGLAAVYITTLDGAQLAAIKDDKTPAAEESLALDQARTLVRQTIKKLSEQERQLLELYYYKDMSLQEVGQTLGLSKSWTSRLHARVIEKLHRLLHDSLG